MGGRIEEDLKKDMLEHGITRVANLIKGNAKKIYYTVDEKQVRYLASLTDEHEINALIKALFPNDDEVNREKLTDIKEALINTLDPKIDKNNLLQGLMLSCGEQFYSCALVSILNLGNKHIIPHPVDKPTKSLKSLRSFCEQVKNPQYASVIESVPDPDFKSPETVATRELMAKLREILTQVKATKKVDREYLLSLVQLDAGYGSECAYYLFVTGGLKEYKQAILNGLKEHTDIYDSLCDGVQRKSGALSRLRSTFFQPEMEPIFKSCALMAIIDTGSRHGKMHGPQDKPTAHRTLLIKAIKEHGAEKAQAPKLGGN